jgi:nucleoside-diphosphate-sugar epimerase
MPINATIVSLNASSAEHIITKDDLVLVTGAAGFIGSKVVEDLLALGFTRIRCFVRPSSDLKRLEACMARSGNPDRVELIKGNLQSREACETAVENVAVIYHLAAASGKSFPGTFMNCVVTTRNLLAASVDRRGPLRRFVNISSFAVYTNRNKAQSRVLDESCPVEDQANLRADAYCFAKLKQDELVVDYGIKHQIPYTIVRPGVVYGPGKERIHGRIGLDTFGIFLHLGGSNPIPFTHVDNCAKAIVLAGLIKGIDGEIFNVVDDDLPSSRQFLRMYKKQVRQFSSVYIPHVLSYLLCLLWEKYSGWSEGQLPPVYNRRVWAASWKRTRYSNAKLKRSLGWTPIKSTADGLHEFFASCRSNGVDA